MDCNAPGLKFHQKIGCFLCPSIRLGDPTNIWVVAFRNAIIILAIIVILFFLAPATLVYLGFDKQASNTFDTLFSKKVLGRMVIISIILGPLLAYIGDIMKYSKNISDMPKQAKLGVTLAAENMGEIPSSARDAAASLVDTGLNAVEKAAEVVSDLTGRDSTSSKFPRRRSLMTNLSSKRGVPL